MVSEKNYVFCSCFNFTPGSMLLYPGRSVGFSQILKPFFCLQVTIRSDKEKQEQQQVEVTVKIRQPSGSRDSSTMGGH